jgi:transaldolase
VLSPDGGDYAAVLAEYEKAGFDVAALAQKLQDDGAKSFVQSWQDLLKAIETKCLALA